VKPSAQLICGACEVTMDAEEADVDSEAETETLNEMGDAA
jgi:hypothetical protein